ncbi:MAG TPA: YggT family protein [Thermomicrobiales bacterium]|jgi:YggT family protein|nr:YggT family protein [Thermomicrobiales bacterium]
MPVEIVNVIILLLNGFSLLIIGRALTSWFDPQMSSPVGRFLYNATEPVIGPLRQIIPSLGMIDITPIVALLLIQVITQILASSV